MKTLLYSSMLKGKTLEELKEKYPNIVFKETSCEGLEESQPLVICIPDCTFYGPVMTTRITDIVVDNADDIKIQTSRLFDVEMERYMSEPRYRRIVLELRMQLEELDNFTSTNISSLIKSYATTNKQALGEVVNSLKIAMIKTTKGPAIGDVFEAYGQQASLRRIDKYLGGYKYRY